MSARAVERESERLTAVRRYQILDTPPDGSFDRITRLAAQLFDVPIVIVSIVDDDRVWFKSCYGLDGVREVPRDNRLSTSTLQDPAVYPGAFVANHLDAQFHASAPLKTHDGHRLGTLDLFDRRTREFSIEERSVLETLASIVMDQMELRIRALGTVSAERTLRREAAQWAKDNESLYQRERFVTRVLQKALLPRAFPAVRGVHFDAVYVPTESELCVGGDWYDAYLIDDDHLMLSIGDVAGHGISAASLMGSLRPSLRAFAAAERSPVKLLHSLDAMLRHEGEDTMVTCFVAIVDLRNRTLLYANAGQSRALLRTADGSVRELAVTGAPLGLRSDIDPQDAALHLPPNCLLLLYTDGLTESSRDIIVGEQRVRDALASSALASDNAPAQALCKFVLPDGNRNGDDVAIMSILFE